MKILTLMFLGVFLVKAGNSQTLTPEVYAFSGDYFTGVNSSLSWTLGECVIETDSSTNNILTQGFQQSQYLITTIEEYSKVAVPVSIYPNPTKDILNIHLDLSDKKELRLEMLDASGKLIHSELYHGDLKLNLSDYTSSEYFIRVSDTSNNSTKTFKLIKTN